MYIDVDHENINVPTSTIYFYIHVPTLMSITKMCAKVTSGWFGSDPMKKF